MSLSRHEFVLSAHPPAHRKNGLSLPFFHYPAKSLQLSLNVYEDLIFNAVSKGGKNTGKPLLLSFKATNILFGFFYSDDASSVYLSFSLSWITFFMLCILQLRSTKVDILFFPLRLELVELFSAKLKSRLLDYLTVVHLPIEPHHASTTTHAGLKNCLYTSACMFMYTVKVSWDSVPHNNNSNNNK